VLGSTAHEMGNRTVGRRTLQEWTEGVGGTHLLWMLEVRVRMFIRCFILIFFMSTTSVLFIMHFFFFHFFILLFFFFFLSLFIRPFMHLFIYHLSSSSLSPACLLGARVPVSELVLPSVLLTREI